MTTATETKPNITYTQTGKHTYTIDPLTLENGQPLTKDYLEKSILSMKWTRIDDGQKHSEAMMPALAINEVIRTQQPKPKTTAYAISHELAPYSLLGVQFDYKNAVVNSYWIDTGTSVISVATIPTYKTAPPLHPIEQTRQNLIDALQQDKTRLEKRLTELESDIDTSATTTAEIEQIRDELDDIDAELDAV
jgi:hypothetical protein